MCDIVCTQFDQSIEADSLPISSKKSRRTSVTILRRLARNVCAVRLAGLRFLMTLPYTRKLESSDVEEKEQTRVIIVLEEWQPFAYYVDIITVLISFAYTYPRDLGK